MWGKPGVPAPAPPHTTQGHNGTSLWRLHLERSPRSPGGPSLSRPSLEDPHMLPRGQASTRPNPGAPCRRWAGILQGGGCGCPRVSGQGRPGLWCPEFHLQVLVGNGALGLRAPCPVEVATGIAPKAVAHTALWSSPPVVCSLVQVRTATGSLLFLSPPTSGCRNYPQQLRLAQSWCFWQTGEHRGMLGVPR